MPLVVPRTARTAVKAVDNGDGTMSVKGYLVVFDDPAAPEKDLAGDYFTSSTYFGPRDGDGADGMFHHGIPVDVKLAGLADVLFPPLKVTKDDVGLFAEVVLDMADEYHAVVATLAQKGALGWSSGSAPHMVKRLADGQITRWPIAEGSLTPQPCEPRTVMKSLPTVPTPATPPAAKAVDFSGGINALRERVQNAARAHLTDPLTGRHPWCWVVDVFPDACVLEFDDVEGYRVPLDVDADGTVTLGPREDWVEVERVTDWRPVAKSLDDALTALVSADTSGEGTSPTAPDGTGIGSDLDALNALLGDILRPSGLAA